MKRSLALLFSALMLTGVLSGCGTTTKTDTTGGSGSGTTTNGTTTNGSTASGSKTTTSTTSSAKTTTVRPGGTTAPKVNTVKNSNTLNRASGMVADPAYPANTANQSTVIRGATYGQMLRNGRVHDTNGILTDGENAVTPGTTVY